MRTSVWKLYCSLWLDSFCVARWPHGRWDCGRCPSEPTCKIKCKGEVEWVNKHNSEKITVCILNIMYLISRFNSPLFLLPVKSAQAKLSPRVLSTFYMFHRKQTRGSEWRGVLLVVWYVNIWIAYLWWFGGWFMVCLYVLLRSIYFWKVVKSRIGGLNPLPSL